MKRIVPSRLHRVFGWRRGHAPNRSYTSECPGDASLPMDVGAGVFAIGVFAGIIGLGEWLGWLRWVAFGFSLCLIAASIAYFRLIYDPFNNSERYARARIRRHKCVICGAKIVSDGAEQCDECENSN